MDKWNIEDETGYKPITTFWKDFSIADRFGLDAIQDTYNRAFSEWKDDYKYLTEFVMVLNHKCWDYYRKNKEKYYELYLKLFEEANAYALNNLKDEEFGYFYEVTN